MRVQIVEHADCTANTEKKKLRSVGSNTGEAPVYNRPFDTRSINETEQEKVNRTGIIARSKKVGRSRSRRNITYSKVE